jgi:indolepyruvate ferredoxin oxidoreductase
MAAHLERKGVTVLDMTGLARKGGAVVSHVQIAPAPDALHATRERTGEARLIIGCDALVSASPEVLSKTREGQTSAVVNTANTPTADFVKDRDWRLAIPPNGAPSAGWSPNTSSWSTTCALR